MPYVLDDNFCESYNTDIDERYACYKLIGSKKSKSDNAYCELKFPTETAKMYECFKTNGVSQGADYCYLTYFWPD